MSSRHRLYLDLKKSFIELFRTPAYYLKEQTGKWSIFEKPYLDQDYRAMHLNLSKPRWGSGAKSRVPKPYGYRKWIFQWGPSPCWVGTANPECGTAFEIEAGIALPPPHSFQARALFSVTSSDPTKVWLTKIEPSGWSSFDATLHFQAKAEWEGVVTICVRASLEGQYLSELVFQVPEQFQGGLRLEQAFSGGNLVASGSTLGGAKEISRQYQGGLYNNPEAKKPGVFEGASNRLNMDIGTSDISTPTPVGDSPGRESSGSMDCGCVDVVVSCDLCDDSTIVWNGTTSAETIARNGNATVAILDPLNKGSLYTWGVSGTGFTLDYVTTDKGVLTNTLRADATACGTATVTVTGCDGKVVTGYVRCTTGQWVQQSCEYDWPFAPAASGTINGKYKLEGSNSLCANSYTDYNTEAACNSALASEQTNFTHRCCPSYGLPQCTKGCTERIPQICSAGYTKGTIWDFCYKPCYWTGYKWRYMWQYYSSIIAYVYLWEC